MIKNDKIKDSFPQFKKKPPTRKKGDETKQIKSYVSKNLKFKGNPHILEIRLFC